MSLKKERKMIKTAAMYTIGTMFNKAIAFVCIPVFSRILTESEYGVLNTFDSYASILTVIVGLAVYETVRNAFVDYSGQLEKYVSVINTLVSVVYLVSMFVALGINLALWNISSFLVILCFTKAFSTSILNTISHYYMMEERVYQRTFVQVVPNLVGSLLGVVIVINMKGARYYGRIIPIVAVSMLLALYYIFSFSLKGKRLVDVSIWKYALKICLPIIPHGLSVTVLASSDRIMISSIVGMSEAGIYGLTYNFGMVAFALISALESVWIPRFTRHMVAEEYNSVKNEATIYAMISSYIIFVIMLCAKEVFMLFASENYWDGLVIIPPVMMASFLINLYSIQADTEMYYKKSNYVALASGIAALLNIVLNIIFIRMYGYQAAAYTTIVSYFVLYLIHFAFVKKIHQSLYSFVQFLPAILLQLLGFGLYYWCFDLPFFRWGIAFVSFLIIVIVVITRSSKLKKA